MATAMLERTHEKLTSTANMNGASSNPVDGRWVDIQKKTFVNWCNEQLSAGGRSVEDLDVDFCDGVKVGGGGGRGKWGRGGRGGGS